LALFDFFKAELFFGFFWFLGIEITPGAKELPQITKSWVQKRA